MAKLTKRQTEAIRSKYTGERGQITKLAKEYNITVGRVSQIVKTQREFFKAWTQKNQETLDAVNEYVVVSEADLVY